MQYRVTPAKTQTKNVRQLGSIWTRGGEERETNREPKLKGRNGSSESDQFKIKQRLGGVGV